MCLYRILREGMGYLLRICWSIESRQKKTWKAVVPFVESGDMKREKEDIFLYGHNMRNGAMFADLLKYQIRIIMRHIQ